MKLTNNGQHRGEDTWTLYVWEAPLYISGETQTAAGLLATTPSGSAWVLLISGFLAKMGRA